MASDRSSWQASTQYFLQESLGEGMSSQVFRAERSISKLGLRQTVAIKVLKSENAVEMWRQEFESLARVKSPFCVQVFAFEEVESKPALVLEFVDGLNLRELIQYGHLSSDDCREILAQVQAGLQDLEQANLSHGDLSPKNIMVDVRGQVRLLDFGLANCRTDQPFFTPGFAAPELLSHGTPNAQTDMYSLGAVAGFLERYAQTEKLIESDLKNASPQARSWLKLALVPARQLALAAKVLAAQEKRTALANLKTRTLPLKVARVPKPLLRLQLLLVAAALVFSSDSSQAFRANISSKTGATAALQVRTLAWHYIYIDGRPVGYAPLDLSQLPAGPHEITWRNAQSSGRIQVQLKKGTTKTLTERDLQSY